ncbi:MAG: IS200/IS605 family transposase [Phycisphaerae bacterium]|nr:IS200/IS605 family transposase [Phycisphaerae bacterium]
MGQTLSCLHYHLVFSTKNRLPQITPDLRERLYDYMGGIIKAERGLLLDAGGTEDHVHLLVSLPAHPSAADFLRLMKTNSSKWVHATFQQHRAFAWQSGYGAFSVSRSNDSEVRRYISSQQQHHRRMTFQEEFLAFLRRHEIAYDERYIWE